MSFIWLSFFSYDFGIDSSNIGLGPMGTSVFILTLTVFPARSRKSVYSKSFGENEDEPFVFHTTNPRYPPGRVREQVHVPSESDEHGCIITAPTSQVKTWLSAKPAWVGSPALVSMVPQPKVFPHVNHAAN